ncbi:MAG: carbohydrate-binding protein [Fibrobacter sp.]|nr:carbohydrate-binding protein [Fibrobacter sp.]
MEDYDVGGQGISYFDNDPENQGNVYREDGVDIVGLGCSDTLNTENCAGYAIGYTNAGEWLEYSFNAVTGAKFIFVAHVASGLEGAGFMLFVDGKAVTDTIVIPAGEDWDTYTDVKGETAMIEKGQHILRVKFTGAYGNMDWIQFALTEEEIIGLHKGKNLVRMNFNENGANVQYYDMQGHRLNKAATKRPGIYLVKTPQGSFMKRVEKR